MSSKLQNIIISFNIPLIIFLICGIYIANIDRNIWTEVTKHADEFVYDHDSFDGNYIVMKLYDQDSTYVCEAFMSVRDRKTAIFKDRDLLASSANSFWSRKMYKLLLKNVPDYIIAKSNSKAKDEVLQKLKTL
jgi:hypothetical protein